MVAPPTFFGQLQYFDLGKHSASLGRKIYLRAQGRLQPAIDFAGYRIYQAAARFIRANSRSFRNMNR
jgi:hypothetical protein